jgi:hypothetical protein
MNAPVPAWAPPLLVAACFVGLWLFVTWLISHTSGWVTLARIYRAENAATGIPVRLRAVRMGCSLLGQYRNVLTLWAGANGIQLHMLFLFAINSPDLFIPWSDITVTRGRQWFFDYVELRFRGAPEIPLRIYGEAAARVQEAAGADWPEVKARGAVPDF